jgi:hypothetical protein
MVPVPKRKAETPNQAPVQAGAKEAFRETIQPNKIQDGSATKKTVLKQNHPLAIL